MSALLTKKSLKALKTKITRAWSEKRKHVRTVFLMYVTTYSYAYGQNTEKDLGKKKVRFVINTSTRTRTSLNPPSRVSLTFLPSHYYFPLFDSPVLFAPHSRQMDLC